MSNEIKDIDKLIEALNQLRIELNDSLVEAYCGMKAVSEHGQNCRYVLQSASKMIASKKLDQLVSICSEISLIEDQLDFLKEDFLNGRVPR